MLVVYTSSSRQYIHYEMHLKCIITMKVSIYNCTSIDVNFETTDHTTIPCVFTTIYGQCHLSSWVGFVSASNSVSCKRTWLDNTGSSLAAKSLQWRHNGRDSVSNHQPYYCLLNHLFRRRSKKTSKLRITGLYAWSSPVTDEFPAQMASNAENVSIWWRHHVVRTADQVWTGSRHGNRSIKISIMGNFVGSER